jgi:hypothetical protein
MVPSGFQERRFLVLDVSTDKQRDNVYFDSMREELENGGYEAMLYDLLNMDISDVNLREIPKTTATRDNIVGSLNLEESYWLYRLEKGTIVDDHSHWKRVVIKKKLYDDYLKYCREISRHGRPTHMSTFFKKLSKLCPEMETGRLRCCPHNSTQYTVYTLPDLDECRRLFDVVIGAKNKGVWDDIYEVDEEKQFEDCPFKYSEGVF